MTKLEKFLFKNSNYYQESISTYSKYYKISNCMIRLSDHYSSSPDYDLGIITPINKSSKYLISIPGSTKFYLWSVKEILDFLPEFIKYCELKSKSLKESNDKSLKESNEIKIIKVVSKYNGKLGCSRIVVRPKNNMWTKEELLELPRLLNYEFNSNISSLPEVFEDYLLSHACSYSKAINLYKCFYIDNIGLDVTKELLTQTLNRL